MDIFFQDPNEIPLPPEEVRIREFNAEPWPDGRRVKVYLEVDPFQKRPNAEVVLYDQEDTEVARASVIEAMTRQMEFTMHIRRHENVGRFTLKATLFYTEPLPEPGQDDEERPLELPASTIVDQAETNFEIPPSGSPG